MSAKHCTRACCVRACSESISDVIVNAKNNFGDPLDVMCNIVCARSVPENVGLQLKNVYIATSLNYKFELVLFLGSAFVPR